MGNLYRLSLLFVGMLSAASISLQPALAAPGEKDETPKQRTLLKIPYQDRELLLQVMRNNLANLGRLLDAMSKDDFKTVEKIAGKMSLNLKKAKGLTRRGNPAFTAMGLKFHGAKVIAVKRAAEARDRKRTLSAMANMVTTCVACHATFRVMEWPNDKNYQRPKPIPLVLPPGVVIQSK